MQLSLKGLGHQPFARDEDSLRSWNPADPENFGAWFTAAIGADGEPACDDFDGFVCTPRWLEENDWDDVERGRLVPGTLWGRALVIQRRWSYDDLRATVEAMCVSVEGPAWRPLASWADRFLAWEYDYRYEEEQGIRNLADERARRRKAQAWDGE